MLASKLKFSFCRNFSIPKFARAAHNVLASRKLSDTNEKKRKEKPVLKKGMDCRSRLKRPAFESTTTAKTLYDDYTSHCNFEPSAFMDANKSRSLNNFRYVCLQLFP